MNAIKRQVAILREARAIRNLYRRIKLDSMHRRYLLDFLKQHNLALFSVLFLLFAQGLIEALLIIFSRNQLASQKQFLFIPFFWQLLAFLFVVFFINSFLSIRQEKTLGVVFANQLRRRIFKNYLNRPLAQMNQEKQADLLAKISYQLPLASLGVANSFFGTLRWLIDVLVIVFLSVLGGLPWALVLLFVFGLSVLVVLATYFVSKSYISQEVTFYSQIIKEIDTATKEKYFLKIFNHEKPVLGRFDRLVDFDSFFRIRRDLWMKLCAKVLFAILLFLSVLSHFFSTSFFTWFNLAGPEKKFLFLFLIIYFSRALYESLRVGLYLWPARLGLFLTILKPNKVLRQENIFHFSKSLQFYGRKIKLFKEAPYWRHFDVSFEKCGRYLFYSATAKGKSCLARLLSGREAFSEKALLVKIDGQRLSYSAWQKYGAGICFFDPNFSSEKSLLEFVLGSSRENTDFSEIEKALVTLKTYSLASSLISPDNNYNSSSVLAFSSPLSSFALFACHCLVKKPELIIIDNVWLDLGYEEINKMLLLLDKELPETTFVVFSRGDNNLLAYQKKHEIRYEE